MILVNVYAQERHKIVNNAAETTAVVLPWARANMKVTPQAKRVLAIFLAFKKWREITPHCDPSVFVRKRARIIL